MVDLSGRDIPRLAASLQLSAQSASLASQGPALLAARSEEALNERSKKMKETQTIALQKLGEIIELGADKTVVTALTETVKNIDDMIKSLGSPRASGSKPPPCTRSNTPRCAKRRPASLRLRARR